MWRLHSCEASPLILPPDLFEAHVFYRAAQEKSADARVTFRPGEIVSNLSAFRLQNHLRH
jgi:hypothetical protein